MPTLRHRRRYSLPRIARSLSARKHPTFWALVAKAIKAERARSARRIAVIIGRIENQHPNKP